MVKLFGILLIALIMFISVDAEVCKELEEKCWNKCTEISSDAVKENCKGNGYSGCALDVIGCRGHFCDYVYVQKWFDIPNYKSCIDPYISEYYSCVDVCNPKFRARTTYGEGLTILRECPKKCSEDFDAKWLECKNKACDSDCQKKGSSGGQWVRYSGKLGWDSCECEEIPTQENVSRHEDKPEIDKIDKSEVPEIPEVIDIDAMEESFKKESDGIDNASKELNDVVDYIKRLREEGADDLEIALAVRRIVENKIDPINNFWVSPISWLKDNFLGSYKNIDEWRAFKASDYDTIAIWTWNNRIGQCEEIVSTVYYILKNAGMKVDIYNQAPPGDHAFVIMNMDEKNSLSDSRNWVDYVDTPVLIIDSWQHTLLNSGDAYYDGKIMNGGKTSIMPQTSYYTPKEGYEDIKNRNIVWDKNKRHWRCRTGYKQEMFIDENGRQRFSGHCILK